MTREERIDEALERLEALRERGAAMLAECYSARLGGFDEAAYRRYIDHMPLVHDAEDAYREALEEE